MTEHIGEWGLGPAQAMPAHRQDRATLRFGELYVEASRRHQHLWIVTVGYLVAVPLAKGTILDADNLIVMPQVGCWVCERAYAPGMEATYCTGEPEERP